MPKDKQTKRGTSRGETRDGWGRSERGNFSLCDFSHLMNMKPYGCISLFFSFFQVLLTCS